MKRHLRRPLSRHKTQAEEVGFLPSFHVVGNLRGKRLWPSGSFLDNPVQPCCNFSRHMLTKAIMNVAELAAVGWLGSEGPDERSCQESANGSRHERFDV